MHELGIVFHVIDDVKEIGKENSLTRVNSVTLEIGEVTGVFPDYFEDCFRWACDRTELLKGAKLNLLTIPAVTFCEDCKKTYPTVQFGKICPNCGSEHTYLLQGNEFSIKEIEAE